jgi:uncharacterized protein DUF7033
VSLVVRFSDRFVAERHYVFDVLLGDFLGLDYVIQIEPGARGYVIELPNGRRLWMRDAFFGDLPDSTAYLTSSSLPRGTRIVARLPFAPEADAVVLFGEGDVVQEGADLHCGVDIVATMFFMLGRWEEALPDPPLDEHGRWRGASSVAFAGAFLHRPIVNEYVEAVWSMLAHLECRQPRRERRFSLVPTHDLDIIYPSRIRTLGHAAFRARSARAMMQAARIALSTGSPFDTFDWLMDLSESVGVRSRFNLLGGGTSPRYDEGRYRLADARVRAIVRHILDRHHLLGFHPSYSAHLNPAQWASERRAIEAAFGVTLSEGRHHYLRFRVPETWRMWDEGGMAVDSTAGYADVEGFRCGTGDLFPTFDVRRRRALRLKERPLVIMEGTLAGYRKLSARGSQEVVRRYIEVAARYRMPLTILFHNNSFDEVRWPGWRQAYQTIFDLSQGVGQRD